MFEENKKGNSTSFGYYSKVLNKPFDTIEELKKAERGYLDAQKAKEMRLDEKKKLAHEVENSYKEYIKVVERTNKEFDEVKVRLNKERKDAETKYNKLKNNFIKEYGSFHMTYNKESNDVEVTSDDNIGSISMYDLLKELFF